MNDRRRERFSARMIARWERLVGYLAVALGKIRAEETLLRQTALLESIQQDQLREKKEGELAESEGRFRQLAENIRFVRDDGRTVWVKARAYPVRDGAGKAIRIVGVVEDSTESRLTRKRLTDSLREKELLLRELHHRVKNNLQVVSSLLGLQMKAMDDPRIGEALRDSQDRIRSMAQVHEALYQANDFARIDGIKYVRDTVTNLRNSYELYSSKISVDIQGETVPLMIEQAVPFGLLLNELVANIFKHAFPDGETGELRIELKLQEGNRAFFKVADNGIGLPAALDLKKPSTLGLQLVDMLIRQLDGELKVERDGGTAFMISFQLKESKANL